MELDEEYEDMKFEPEVTVTVEVKKLYELFKTVAKGDIEPKEALMFALGIEDKE